GDETFGGDVDLAAPDADDRPRRKRRLLERDVVDHRRRLERERADEDACGPELDEHVLDARLIDGQADLAVRARADERALGLDGELLHLSRVEPDLELQYTHVTGLRRWS